MKKVEIYPGCYCAPEACHGDVIIKLWEEQNQQQEGVE